MEHTSVTQFCDLPPETRHEIWALTLPGPRIVHAGRYPRTPHALHINRESRSIALKHYELVQPRHPKTGHTNGRWHRCLKGYINFEIDFICMTALATCEDIDKKICNLQEKGSILGSMSQARLFVMTEHAAMKFPRLRSYKSVLHFQPHLRGVEFIDLPARISDVAFQEKLDAMAASIKLRVEELRATKALEISSWEPPVYHFARCQRDAARLKCESPFSCDDALGPTKG